MSMLRRRKGQCNKIPRSLRLCLRSQLLSLSLTLCAKPDSRSPSASTSATPPEGGGGLGVRRWLGTRATRVWGGLCGGWQKRGGWALFATLAKIPPPTSQSAERGGKIQPAPHPPAAPATKFHTDPV